MELMRGRSLGGKSWLFFMGEKMGIICRDTVLKGTVIFYFSF